MKLHTHYDNLKVARNAPPEVIKAAYKAMAQKWHPDKNPGNPEAPRVMRLVNEAYDVLSNPVTRAEHDKWIRAQENQEREASATAPVPHPRTQQTPAPAPAPEPLGVFRAAGYLVGWTFRRWWLVLIAFGAVAIYTERPKQHPQPAQYARDEPASPIQEPEKPIARAPMAATPPPRASISAPAYQRPFLAPNGEMWPVVAGYLRETPIRASGGLSSFTVDNTRNDSDVYAKLFVAGTKPPSEVRQAYIPAHSSFTFKELAPNRYDLRTMDLNTGALLKSEEFSIIEVSTDSGVRYSDSSITLYKVANGNSRSFNISQKEFER